MKRFGFLNSPLLVGLVLMLISCKGVFIDDPLDPRLPKYSESGNNVAGAFINNETWRSVVRYTLTTIIDKPLISVFAIHDSLVIHFEGERAGQYTAIEFLLTGLNINKFDDLSLLRDRKIQLDGLKNTVIIRDAMYTSTSVDHRLRGVGQIYIKNIVFNDQSDRATLSGTFGFTISDSASVKADVSYGRFDYALSKSSNFRIK